MTNSQRQVVWLCGKQASGKTFAGDYLQTRGWHHVDGDLGKTSDDAAVQKAWADLFEGYLAKGKGESCPEGCWIPYYEYLAGEIERGLETNDRVVTTFAMMGLFDGDEEFLRSRFPDIKFVAIECDTSELLNRWYARCERIFGERDMTIRSMTAAPVESCQSPPIRCPWGRLGSVLYTCNRLRRIRRRFNHFWSISLSRPLGLAIFWP